MTTRSGSRGIKKATHHTSRQKSLVMGKKQYDFKHCRRIEKKSVILKNQAKQKVLKNIYFMYFFKRDKR